MERSRWRRLDRPAVSVYQQVNAKVTNVTPKSYSPFSASAVLPNGGSLSANGNGGAVQPVQ